MAQVTILKTDMHRNGVGGESFAIVNFTHEDSDRPLIAVIPTRFRSEPDAGWEQTYVIDPTDITLHWRGDSVYHDLLEAGLWERVSVDAEQRLADTLAGVRSTVSPW